MLTRVSFLKLNRRKKFLHNTSSCIFVVAATIFSLINPRPFKFFCNPCSASNSSYLILIYDIIFLTILIFIMGIVFVTWKHRKKIVVSVEIQKKETNHLKNAKWTNFVLVSSHGEFFSIL